MVREEIKNAFNCLLKDKKAMRDLSLLTKIMVKLNKQELAALMRYYKIIEENARRDERMKIWEFLFKKEKNK